MCTNLVLMHIILTH